MNRMIGVVLAVAVFAAVAAGAARADRTDWCGQAEGTCDTSSTYVQCSDGSSWVLDSTWSPDAFGEEFCDGAYTVPSPPSFTQQSDDSNGTDQTSAGDFDLAPNMNPDPVQYVTEIQCPNGQTWAVASGDDFVCPTA